MPTISVSGVRDVGVDQILYVITSTKALCQITVAFQIS